MFHRSRLALLVPVVAAGLLGAACNAREAPVSVTNAAVAIAPATAPALPFPAEAPLSCATLRDVGVSDVVRVDGTTLFYADATAGLTAVDVTDAAHPRVLSTVPFVGTPLALFVRDGIAWVVFLDPDSRSGKTGPATVVRAVDVRSPAAPRIVGDEVREGSARDVKLVGGVLYLLRATNGRSVVESFGVLGTVLRALDSVAVEGAPAQLAASSAGLAVVTTSDDHATVGWLDLSMERPGSLLLRQSVRLPGGVATWERGEGKIVDADDGQRVRIVTCATASCTPSEPATLRVVDFAAAGAASSMTSLRLTEHDSLPTTRFTDGVLYVAEAPAPGHESTTLRVVRTEGGPPRFVASHTLRGRISALVPHGDSLVAMGSTGSADTQLRIIMHDLDVRRPSAPRTRSSVTFGSDWTWSLLADDDDAMSFDPASHLIAVPFTAWRHADKRYVNGAQLVDLSPLGTRMTATMPVDGWVERAVFLDGHLVTLGPKGVSSIDYSAAYQSDFGERSIDLGR
jgi:hypothetical protein